MIVVVVAAVVVMIIINKRKGDTFVSPLGKESLSRLLVSL